MKAKIKLRPTATARPVKAAPVPVPAKVAPDVFAARSAAAKKAWATRRAWKAAGKKGEV